MRQVIYALLPGIIISIWVLGWGILIHAIIAIIFSIAFEATILGIRKYPIKCFLSDGSAIITALLFTLTISPYTPWWATCLGMFFAIVVAKHLYGGIGQNIFNPAMLAYAFLLLCFPAQMTQWPMLTEQLSFSDSFNIIFYGITQVDSLSGATPLAFTKSQLSGMTMLSELKEMPSFSKLHWEYWAGMNVAFLAGGIWLIFKKVIKWQIPVGMLATLFLFSLIMYAYNSEHYTSPVFHLLSGGTMLAAFFIATDPVTAATTPYGRLIYASGIAILTYIIRVWGGYPDGFAFSVLIMNAMVPFIDYVAKPRVLGTKS